MDGTSGGSEHLVSRYICNMHNIGNAFEVNKLYYIGITLSTGIKFTT